MESKGRTRDDRAEGGGWVAGNATPYVTSLNLRQVAASPPSRRCRRHEPSLEHGESHTKVRQLLSL